MKIHPVGAELFHVNGWTDGRTDRYDEADSRFSQLCEGTSKTGEKKKNIIDHYNPTLSSIRSTGM